MSATPAALKCESCGGLVPPTIARLAQRGRGMMVICDSCLFDLGDLDEDTWQERNRLRTQDEHDAT